MPSGVFSSTLGPYTLSASCLIRTEMFPGIASLLGVIVASTVLTTTVLDNFPHGAGRQRHVTDSHPWGVCGNERQLREEGLFHICSLSGLLASCGGVWWGRTAKAWAVMEPQGGRSHRVGEASGWEKPQDGRSLNDCVKQNLPPRAEVKCSVKKGLNHVRR